jgi:hypothetical protein
MSQKYRWILHHRFALKIQMNLPLLFGPKILNYLQHQIDH